MLLEHHGTDVPMCEVLQRARSLNAYDEDRGWLHAGLVELLWTYGLPAHRRNWRLLDGAEAQYLGGRRRDQHAAVEIEFVRSEMVREGVDTIRRWTSSGVPVVVSVYRPWQNQASIGHQIVVLSMNDRRVTFHDPAEPAGAHNQRSIADFLGAWKGLAIIAHGIADQPQ